MARSLSVLCFWFCAAVSGNALGAGVLLYSVPDTHQSTDYTCGLASLQAVLGYYGQSVTEEELVKETGIDPETGAMISMLVKSTEARNLHVEVREGMTFSALEAELRAGRPVIILGQAWAETPTGEDIDPENHSWANEWEAGHYMVAIGITAKDVILEDPWIEGVRGRIPHAEFLNRWHGWSDDGRQIQHQAVVITGAKADPALKPLKLKRVRI